MNYMKCHAGKNSASGAHDWCLLEKSTTEINNNNNNNNNSAAAAVMNNFYIYNLADFQGVEQKNLSGYIKGFPTKNEWLAKPVSLTSKEKSLSRGILYQTGKLLTPLCLFYHPSTKCCVICPSRLKTTFKYRI